jgi:exosortase E/protease (VPEID-CTERM system)
VIAFCSAALAALLLIYCKWFWDKSAQQSEQFRRYAPFWPVFLGHLLVFSGFAAWSALIVRGDMPASSLPQGWALAWGGLGLASLASWSVATFPIGLWQWMLRRWWVAFPAAFGIGVAAVAAGKLTELLWKPLGHSAFWLVNRAFTLAGVETVCKPDYLVVGTPSFAITIGEGCSGYQGIGLLCVFLGVYLWLFRQDFRFPRAFLLFPLGVLIIWLGNVVRLILLVALGTWVSPALAMGGFHSHAGWLAFLAVSLGLAIVAQRSHFFSTATATKDTTDNANPAAPYLAPIMVLVAASMLTGAFSAGFDYGYPLRVVAVAAALWIFRSRYRELGFRVTWSWTALAIGVLTFVIWLALEPASSSAAPTGPPHELENMPALGAGVWLILRIVGSVVTVPLAEELAFRGYLPRQLIAVEFQEVPLGRFTWFSFFLSSAVFGALHGRWLAGTLAGMLYALALYRRGQLGDAVLAHGTTNALLAAYVLAKGTWALWV